MLLKQIFDLSFADVMNRLELLSQIYSCEEDGTIDTKKRKELQQLVLNGNYEDALKKSAILKKLSTEKFVQQLEEERRRAMEALDSNFSDHL